DGVLGQLQVAKGPDERGQHPPPFDPDGLRQQLIRTRAAGTGAVRAHGVAAAGARCGTTGRTSTLPRHAAGIRAAHWTASSRSATSSRKNPPSTSLASAYGPSVSCMSPPGPSATVIVV